MYFHIVTFNVTLTLDDVVMVASGTKPMVTRLETL